MGQPAASRANNEVHFTFSSMRDFRKNPVPQAHVRAACRPAGRKTESKLAYLCASGLYMRVHIDAAGHTRLRRRVRAVVAGATSKRAWSRKSDLDRIDRTTFVTKSLSNVSIEKKNETTHVNVLANVSNTYANLAQ